MRKGKTGHSIFHLLVCYSGACLGNRRVFIVNTHSNTCAVRLSAAGKKDSRLGHSTSYMHAGLVKEGERNGLLMKSNLCINAIILPRQARDKHRESTQKRLLFSAVAAHEESINVKGEDEPVLIHVAETVHGPIVSQCAGEHAQAYLLRGTLVYKPKDSNRDWSPCFATNRDKNGRIRTKTAGDFNFGVP